MYKPLVAERVAGRITITTQEATHGAKQRLTYPLPARLVRLIFNNLTEQVKLYEFVVLRGVRKIEQYGTPDATYPLRSGFFSRLLGQQAVVYFYKLTPDLLDEQAVSLTPEEEEEVRAAIPEGDEDNFHDYTLGVGNRLDVIGSVHLDELLGVLHRTRAHTQREFQQAVDLLADVRVSLYDQVELEVASSDEDVLDLAVHNIYDFFVPPSEKEAAKPQKKKGKAKPKDGEQQVQVLPAAQEQQVQGDALPEKADAEDSPQAEQLPWTPEGEALAQPEQGDLEQTMVFSPKQQRALQQAMAQQPDDADDEKGEDAQAINEGEAAVDQADKVDEPQQDAQPEQEQPVEDAAQDEHTDEDAAQTEPPVAEDAAQDQPEDQPTSSKRASKKARRQARKAEQARKQAEQEQAELDVQQPEGADMEQTMSLPPVPVTVKSIDALDDTDWDALYDDEDDAWERQQADEGQADAYEQDDEEEEVPAWLVRTPIQRKPGSIARRSAAVREESNKKPGGIKRFFSSLLHFIGIEEAEEDYDDQDEREQWLEEALEHQQSSKQARVYERRYTSRQDADEEEDVTPAPGKPVIRVVPRDLPDEEQPTMQIKGIVKRSGRDNQ